MGANFTFTQFLRSVRGGYVALAAGDALGVPVETMSHEAIMKATGGAGITGYVPPKQHRVKDTANLPPGSWSDDTQLTLVTGGSLVRSRGFDLRDQAMSLAEARESSSFGWGGTTTAAADGFIAWRDSGGAKGRHPEHPAPPPAKDGESAGSGPAMKVFPLAAYCLIGRDSPQAEMKFLDHAMDLGRMTHGDLRAVIASVALGHAAAELAHAPTDAPDAFFTGTVPLEIMRRVVRAENTYRFVQAKDPPFSAYLEKAFEAIGDPVALRTKVNASFLAVHSVPFAIATALRHANDLRAGILEGVNAGRDADTVGSMVGAMLGARHGTDAVPDEWRAGLRGIEVILAAADDLAAMTFGMDPADAKRVVPQWMRDRLH